MFISSMPIFALGLSSLMEQLAQARARRWAAVPSVILVVWNGLFMVQYRLGFIPMSALLTFEQLVLEKFTLVPRILSRLGR